MFEWIKSKITWAQYNAIVTALLAIIAALAQFGVISVNPETVQAIAGAIWVILVALGIGAKLEDIHTDTTTNLNPGENVPIKAKVFKRK